MLVYITLPTCMIQMCVAKVVTHHCPETRSENVGHIGLIAHIWQTVYSCIIFAVDVAAADVAVGGATKKKKSKKINIFLIFIWFPFLLTQNLWNYC